MLAHGITLMAAELRTLRQANKALGKRRRANKSRVRQGGALNIEDTNDISAQEEVDEQIRRDKRSRGVTRNEGQQGVRYYGTCRKSGHNTRTCQEFIVLDSSSDSE